MYKIIYYTKQGEQRRTNEDALLVHGDVVREEGYFTLPDNENFITAVADGMGGHAQGELASSTLLDCLRKKQPKDSNGLVLALMQAKDRLENIATQQKIQLGTAVAGISFVQDRFLIFNVGDCRIYKITKSGDVSLLSKDHTLVNQLKEFCIEDTVLMQQKNILTSAITGGLGSEDFEIFNTYTTLGVGEKLLVCSDGFWNIFEEEIGIIANKYDPLKFVRKNIKHKQVKDDCSFVLLQNIQKESWFRKCRLLRKFLFFG